jgi:hypothetical protein
MAKQYADDFYVSASRRLAQSTISAVATRDTRVLHQQLHNAFVPKSRCIKQRAVVQVRGIHAGVQKQIPHIRFKPQLG